MDVRLVIFDLDGTLIDTMGDYTNKASALIAEHFQLDSCLARNLYIETSGLPFRRQLEQLFPGNYKDDQVAALFEEWKNDYLADGISLPSNIRRTLHHIRRAGLRIAISSNNMQKHLENLTPGWPVDLAMGFVDDRFCKGEPHFVWLEQHFGIARDYMVFVGDSLNDLILSTASGVSFLALLTDLFSEEDFRLLNPAVHLLSEIIELPGRIGIEPLRLFEKMTPGNGLITRS